MFETVRRPRRPAEREEAASAVVDVAYARHPAERHTPVEDRLGRLGLLASAVAGGLVDVAPLNRGARAWTDGATIFVDPDARASDQLGSLAGQASLLGAGSLDSGIVRTLARRQALARRYLAIEGHRALAAQEHVLPASASLLIDRRVAARSQSPADSLAIAMSREGIDDPPEIFGVLRPRQIGLSVLRRPDEVAVQQGLTPPKAGDGLRELDDEGEDDGPVVDLFSSPVGGGGGIGRLLKRIFGDGRSSGGGPPGADSPTHWTRRGARLASTMALTTATAPTPEGIAAAPQRQTTTYPEWDRSRGGYRPNWCTVIEVNPSAEGLAPFVPPDTHALRRPLARLGLEGEPRRRQRQGDDIDIDAAIEARVDAISGSAPDEAIYIDALRIRRDLSVFLLLDISGSAGQPSATGAAVHDHQRAAAAALTLALHDVGDRVALYGFRSQGRFAVHLVPVKRFDDDLDALVMQRLGGLVPGAYTRLGAAIRHGGAVLEKDAGTSKRLLVVLSDGLAYDHGYESAYGEADARHALAEARRRGIGCLCLSIGAGTDEGALRRVFGTAAHASIPRVESLPAVVGPLLGSALRSAELQQKVWQRRRRTRCRRMDRQRMLA